MHRHVVRLLHLHIKSRKRLFSKSSGAKVVQNDGRKSHLGQGNLHFKFAYRKKALVTFLKFSECKD